MQCDLITNVLEPESANFFSVKDQIANIFTLLAMWFLSQLLSSATVVQKQP